MTKLLLASLAFLLLLASCVDNGSSSSSGECTVDTDCIEVGEVCAPNKQCLPLTDPLEVPLGIEIYDHRLNSSTSGKLLLDIGPTDLIPDEDGVVYVTIPDPVAISGTIKTLQGAVNGTIISYRTSNIPGKEIVTETRDLGTITQDPGVTYSFEVVQKGYYLLQLIPNPAHDFAPMLSDVWASGDWVKDFTLGDENYRVRGRVQDTDGIPIAGATLFIFDWMTGHASTVEEITTDASGLFTASFTDIPLSLSVYVTPSDISSLFPADRFDVSQANLASGTVNENGVPTFDIGTLKLQATPDPITFETRIYGRTLSGNRQDVSGARVSFRSVVTNNSVDHGTYNPNGDGTTDATGIIVVEGTTDASGIVRVDLIPGDYSLGRVYEVTVVTPHDSPFTSIKKQIEVGPSSGFGESIELENRIDVVGQITHPETGDPMPTVLVEAAISHNAEELHPESMIDPNYMQTDQSDTQGWFTLRLDPGYYDFWLMFPDNYWLPYSTYTDLVVTPGQEANTNFSFTPAFPSVVRVVLLDATGTPLKDMQVRAYAVSEECDIEDIACDVPARMLSTYTTGADGTATLLVPYNVE